MVSVRFLSTILLLGQALAQPWDGLNPGDTTVTLRPDHWKHRTPSVVHLNADQKRQDTGASSSTPYSFTTTSRATVTIVSTTTVYAVTEFSTTTVTQGTTTGSSSTVLTSATTTTTTSSSTTSTVACSPTTYVIQGADTGDFTVDGNFAQLQSAFGSGYRVLFNGNRASAQQFRLGGPSCDTLLTADNGLQAMVGGNANLHYVYFFPSTAVASALINTNWELLVCVINADNTLSCTGTGESIFQVTEGDPTLELGDQNYGETVTLNLIPVPGSVF